MIKLPTLKKKVKAFLSREDGKISRDKLIKIGVLASAAGISVLGLTQHDVASQQDSTDVVYHQNSMSVGEDNPFWGSHSHSPGYTEHTSHNSHGSGGWC